MPDLTTLIKPTTIDSEGKPIQPSEIVPVLILLLQRLQRLPNFEAMVQECLDDLRYRG